MSDLWKSVLKRNMLAIVLVVVSLMLSACGEDGVVDDEETPTSEDPLVGIWDLDISASDEEFINTEWGTFVVEGMMLVDSETLTLAVTDNEGEGGIGTLLRDSIDPGSLELNEAGNRLATEVEEGVKVLWDKRSSLIPELADTAPLTAQELQGTWRLNAEETTDAFLESGLPVGSVAEIEISLTTFTCAALKRLGVEIPYDIAHGKVVRLRLDELDIEGISFSEPDLLRATLTHNGNKLVFGMAELGKYVEVWDRL